MVQPKSVALAAVVGISLIMPGIAAAQSQPGSGVYIGGSIGQMDAGGDCDPGFSCDFKDTAWKIFGGYKFSPYLAVEGTYGDWGEISISGSAAGVPIRVTGDIWSLGVAAVGMLPLGGGGFSLFGKLGLLYTESKASTTAPGFAFADQSRDETELHFGFGALFNITPNLGLRGEWERLEDSEVDIISIGLQFRF
jgi:OmpA-OmpF porin, OOP family